MIDKKSAVYEKYRWTTNAFCPMRGWRMAVAISATELSDETNGVCHKVYTVDDGLSFILFMSTALTARWGSAILDNIPSSTTKKHISLPAYCQTLQWWGMGIPCQSKIHPDETEPLIWIWHRAINHVFQNSRPKIIICHRTVPSICSTRLLSNLRTVDLLALNKGSLKAGRFWKKLVLQESQSCLVLPPHIDSHLFLPTVISWDTPFPDSSKLAVCLYYKLISCVVQGIFKPSKL